MALTQLQIGQEFSRPSIDQFGNYGSSGIDPNLLRLLAERQRKQGLAGQSTIPTQQPPQPAPGVQPQAAPMSPRLRAALMLQQRRRQQMQQQQAPSYGQVVPRNL